jgi:guanosine-3',5'-bis(diphosphate) 3'-pyrophosphohydrolase
MKIYEVVDFDLLDEDAAQALVYAAQQHAGQTRSDGSPYLEHVKRVAASVEQFKSSHNLDALISAALLHDTIEDTDTTHEDLVKLFGGLVASLVKELTSDKDEIARVGKAKYLANKMSTMSSYALVIKLADRLDNISDITTAKTPEWRRKYRDETLHILDHVENNRHLTQTHRKLIKAIRDKLAEVE